MKKRGRVPSSKVGHGMQKKAPNYAKRKQEEMQRKFRREHGLTLHV